ncbi:MAG TPA: CPBP family intramembrane glutamic endopeptidase [Solirubrobacteraceae bacterium]
MEPDHSFAVESVPPSSAENDWSAWLAPLALIAGLVIAATGALVIDLPAALLFGVSVTASKLPGGLAIADTIVQDGAFVAAAVIIARTGGRTVRSWQFGLRPPRIDRSQAALLAAATLVGFLIFSAIWAEIFNVSTKEKVLEELGSGESTILLLASAGLTCVIAPICEEFLFRGFVFTALSNWHGPWLAAVITGAVFGAVHAGSAPAVYLVPLAALGFGLCLLYRASGSLYPCIAVHAVNNSVAFGSLESWGWQTPILIASSLTIILALALALRRMGVISAAPTIAEHHVLRIASEK